MPLSKEAIARYSRQLILPEIGVKGQERLSRASVLIVGAGGLGSPAALYLAAAGVGRIGLIDPEPVELSNLHRQILHAVADLGRPKVDSARARLQGLNPLVGVEPIQERLDALNVLRRLEPYELVLDGSDNFPTRYLVNDACVLLRKPLVHGGVIRFQGQVLVIAPTQSACLRCVFPEPPQPAEIPDCQTAGVLGASAGVIGSLMAQEAIKRLVGIGRPLTDRLLVVDGLDGQIREVPVRRDPGCAVCGEAPTIRAPAAEADAGCASRADSDREGAWPRNR
jgi:adenylyltransferase/sulfurtransferase